MSSVMPDSEDLGNVTSFTAWGTIYIGDHEITDVERIEFYNSGRGYRIEGEVINVKKTEDDSC